MTIGLLGLILLLLAALSLGALIGAFGVCLMTVSRDSGRAAYCAECRRLWRFVGDDPEPDDLQVEAL